jgi:hypothetical protein
MQNLMDNLEQGGQVSEGLTRFRWWRRNDV